MDCLIVAGFLGSGKTTFILSLARTLIAQGKKIALLENEIGTAPIDGAVLRSEGLWVRELFAGCVCCSLQQDMAAAVSEIYEQVQPDILLVEPTGIATPGMVYKNLQESLPNEVIITTILVVNPRNGTKSNRLSPFLEASVRDSHHVLLNTFGEPRDSFNNEQPGLGSALERNTGKMSQAINVADYKEVAHWYRDTKDCFVSMDSEKAKSDLDFPKRTHLIPGLAGIQLELPKELRGGYEEIRNSVAWLLQDLGRQTFFQDVKNTGEKQTELQTETPDDPPLGHFKAIIVPQGSRLNLTNTGNGNVRIVEPSNIPGDTEIQRIDIQLLAMGIETATLQDLLEKSICKSLNRFFPDYSYE